MEFWGAKLGQAPGERDSEREEKVTYMCVCQGEWWGERYFQDSWLQGLLLILDGGRGERLEN